ncbi:NADP-dependent oxidoreductase [Nevskia soli]|uniref:NADP-dependent oxidoreductase n=1 Tax=Nevskia soli TaxID=418856 RepID=UPI0004A6C3CE|nr:NADP-dependent oxidoreductase [Nevskia soli]
MKEGTVNRRVIVSERPRYAIPTANVFSVTESPVPKIGDRQVLIRTTWLGLDPYLYGRVKRVSSQSSPVQLGQVMVGPTVGRVVASHHPAFAEGDLVQGFWGWQDYFLSDGSRIMKIDPEIPRPSYVLGAFGISGFGAYIAINEYLRVQPGEVLTFGAALGGLGQMIGQIGKMRGAHTIGGAGGPEKCKFAVEELGFDVCLDRRAEDFHDRCLEEFGRAGVDCYAMAAGGRVFRAALPNFNLNARIAVCGLMAFYGMVTLPSGPDMTMAVFNEINLKRLSINGLVTMDWMGTPLHDQFKKDMKEWILGGKIRPVEHVVDGLENAPDGLQGLFEGRNFGKAVVRVAD